MNNYFKNIFVLTILLLSVNSFASSLANDARDREINETCSNYLSQIEESYGLNGLNLTFAHPNSPSIFPSLHISSQKYNNGSSSFFVTLTPDEEYCYLSSVMITAVNNQSCSEIVQIKIDSDENLQVNNYADGGYSVLTPIDNTYQIILTTSGENSCTMTETRMMWPGK
ncbi:MAG: hypothetical protein VYD29_05100 [Pseudomonadota bacterium]|nr:hypothetical protein [Pseudomonadota bacterium]